MALHETLFATALRLPPMTQSPATHCMNVSRRRTPNLSTVLQLIGEDSNYLLFHSSTTLETLPRRSGYRFHFGRL